MAVDTGKWQPTRLLDVVGRAPSAKFAEELGSGPGVARDPLRLALGAMVERPERAGFEGTLALLSMSGVMPGHQENANSMAQLK